MINKYRLVRDTHDNGQDAGLPLFELLEGEGNLVLAYVRCSPETAQFLEQNLSDTARLQSDINKLLAYDSECKKILAQVDIGVVGQSMPERCREAVQRISPCDHPEIEGWSKRPYNFAHGALYEKWCHNCGCVYYTDKF